MNSKGSGGKDLLSLIRTARESGRPVIWDGAVGTQLIARGLTGKAPEFWNMERPDVIMQIHADYFAAGAQVVQTNTFGGNRYKLEVSELSDRLEDINRRAAELARIVCPDHGFVAGDIGPTGRVLVPSGDLSADDAEEAFAKQAEALLKGNVDLFSIETMFDLEEVKAALRGVRRVSDLPVVAHMTFQKTSRGFFTVMGVTPEAAVKGMEDAGADVVGANCTIGIADMVELIRQMRPAAGKPLIAQANAGEPELKHGETIYHDTPEKFASFARALFEAGASAIGSCCGTTPEFIRAVKSKFA
jgi:5-methyltetrahydrofolate--homocysteine methyltransferase